MGLRFGSDDPSSGLGLRFGGSSGLGLPSYGKTTGSRELDPGMRGVYSEVKEDERPGFLERFGKTVGGLGYAVQNIGTALGTAASKHSQFEPKYLGAAAKNLVEMAGSLFTLDPITGVYTKVTGGGITEPWERPTFTESMENVGLQRWVPENKFARFGLDLAGGVFSDPLVYTKFAGKAVPFLADIFKRTGKLPRDELLTAFMATNRGTQAILERSSNVFARMKEHPKYLDRLKRLSKKGLEEHPEVLLSMQRSSRQKAAQEILEDRLGRSMSSLSKEKGRGGDLLENTLEGLRQEGLLERAGIGIDIPWPISPIARRVEKRLTRQPEYYKDTQKLIGHKTVGGHHARYPFIKTKDHPIWGGTGFLDPGPYGLIGRSLPGLAYRRGLRKISPGTTDLIESGLKWIGNNLFKKGLYGIKGRAEHKLATDAAEITKQELYSANTQLARSLGRNLSDIPEEVGKSIVHATHKMSDQLIRAVNDILEFEKTYSPRKMPLGTKIAAYPRTTSKTLHFGSKYYSVVYKDVGLTRKGPSVHDQGTLGAINVWKDRKLVYVDLPKLEELYAQRAWTKGPFYGENVPPDAFNTFEEFVGFMVGAEVRVAEATESVLDKFKKVEEIKPGIEFRDWIFGEHTKEYLPAFGSKIKRPMVRFDNATAKEQMAGFKRDLRFEIKSIDKEADWDSIWRGVKGWEKGWKEGFKDQWARVVDMVAKRHNMHPDHELAESALNTVISGNKGRKTLVQKRVAERIKLHLGETFIDTDSLIDMRGFVEDFLTSLRRGRSNLPDYLGKEFLSVIISQYGKAKFITDLLEAYKLNAVDEFLEDIFKRSGFIEAVEQATAKMAKEAKMTAYPEAWSNRWAEVREDRVDIIPEQYGVPPEDRIALDEAVKVLDSMRLSLHEAKERLVYEVGGAQSDLIENTLIREGLEKRLETLLEDPQFRILDKGREKAAKPRKTRARKLTPKEKKVIDKFTDRAYRAVFLEEGDVVDAAYAVWGMVHKYPHRGLLTPLERELYDATIAWMDDLGIKFDERIKVGSEFMKDITPSEGAWPLFTGKTIKVGAWDDPRRLRPEKHYVITKVHAPSILTKRPLDQRAFENAFRKKPLQGRIEITEFPELSSEQIIGRSKTNVAKEIRSLRKEIPKLKAEETRAGNRIRSMKKELEDSISGLEGGILNWEKEVSRLNKQVTDRQGFWGGISTEKMGDREEWSKAIIERVESLYADKKYKFKANFLLEMIDNRVKGHLEHDEFWAMFLVADLFDRRVFGKASKKRPIGDLRFVARKEGVHLGTVPKELRPAFKAIRKKRKSKRRPGDPRGFYFESPEESASRVVGIFTDEQTVSTFSHELGHAGYHAMLSKTDHGVIGRAHKAAREKGLSGTEDVREFFAEEFARWLSEGMTFSKTLVFYFEKVWHKAKELMSRLFTAGKYKPSHSVQMIFQKLVPKLKSEVQGTGFRWRSRTKRPETIAKELKDAAKSQVDALKRSIVSSLESGEKSYFKKPGMLRAYSDSIDKMIDSGALNYQHRQMFHEVSRLYPEMNPRRIKDALNYVASFNKKILRQTQALGALPTGVTRLELLLYMPRQVSDELANILSSINAQDPKIIKMLMARLGALTSKYEKRRTAVTSEDYRRALIQMSEELGITPTEDVVKDDLIDLLLSRGEAFNRLKYDSKFVRRMASLFGSPKVGRRILPHEVEHEAGIFAEKSAEAFGTGRLESVVDEFLSRLQRDQRRGVGTVLKHSDVDWGMRRVESAEEAGVYIKEPIGFHYPEDTLNIQKFVQEYAIGLAPRKGVSRSFAKLNEFIRMSLTFGVLGLPFPSFTSRNIVGGMLQAMTDPEMRAADAVRPAMAVLHDFPLTRWIAGKVPMSNKARGVSLMRRALGKDQADVQFAMKELEKLNLSVGNIPLTKVTKLIKKHGVVGTDFATVERLKQEVSEPEAFIPMIMSMIGRGADISPKNLKRVPTWFYRNAKTNMLPLQLASAAEDTLRINSFMSLLEAGVDVKAAVRRVNAAHINYHYVSEADRMLRDWMPFVRFRIGTSPRLINAALNNPKDVLPFSYMLNIMQKTHSGSGVIAPDYLIKSFAIPLDEGEDGRVRFISSFGIIHEELENLMEPVATDIADPMKLRRWSQQQIGARLHPVIRTFFEFIGDRNFFRDKPFFAHREAPDWMLRSPFRQAAVNAGLLTEKIKRDGTPYYQVDKWYHPLSTSVGLNRLSDEIGKLFDKEKDWWHRVINSATGIKIKDVDEREELMRVLQKAVKAAHMSGQVKQMSRFYSTGETPEDITELLKAYRAARKSYYSKKSSGSPDRPTYQRGSGLGLPGPIPSRSLSDIYSGR